MVTLQILVLSFLVRIRVSQHSASNKFHSSTLGYGVMVTLQILVLSFLVRIRVSQLKSIFHFERCSFCVYTFHSVFLCLCFFFRRFLEIEKT